MSTLPKLPLHDFPGLEEQVIATALHAALDDLLRGSLSGHQFDALLNGVTERLFHVDVLSGGQRVEDHAMVPMLGSSDQDDIDLFIVQEILILPVTSRLA